jgi:multisubunit Na+/H+ antiporter MnhB subunit
VDFRVFDTLGEITVLALAALGVIALLRLRGSSRRKEAL